MSASPNGPTPLVAARSAEVRDERTAIRRGMRAGTVTLAGVLSDRPACLAPLPLFSLILWRRGWGRDKLRKLGAEAIRERINLGVSLGEASTRTLEWLAAHDAACGRWLP